MLRLLRRPAAAVSRRSRERKLAFLRGAIPAGSSVLVVGVSARQGVGTQSLVERGLMTHAHVVAVTYEPVTAATAYPTALVRADARALPFRDGSFDYVVSNAVVEHLGGWSGAVDFVRESSRVARHGWVHTTPNRRFPLETHTGLPLLHWLPRAPREAAFARLGVAFPEERYHLFSPASLRRLCPAATVRSVSRSRPAMTLMLEWRRPGAS